MYQGQLVTHVYALLMNNLFLLNTLLDEFDLILFYAFAAVVQDGEAPEKARYV